MPDATPKAIRSPHAIAFGPKQNGSISLATHQGRFEKLKRSASAAKVFDLRVDVIGPEEIKERYPLIAVDDVVGGIFIPSDGQANPIDVTRALANGARDGGASSRSALRGFRTNPGRDARTPSRTRRWPK